MSNSTINDTGLPGEGADTTEALKWVDAAEKAINTTRGEGTA